MDEIYFYDFQSYVVGGCVRDSLLGKTPKDWDITTDATPAQMKRIFVMHRDRVIPTGEKYGTITVLMNDIPYEITTFRADGLYSDGRRPDSVTFSKTIEEDLSRRDFTINAMAYNDERGLIDLYGGERDLQNKIIRCVGNPEQRFREDALRIMRAIRFAVFLGFDIEKETLNAIYECGELLENISFERIRDELIKILSYIQEDEKKSQKYRDIIAYIIKRTIPEFRELVQITHNNQYHYTDVFNHTLDVVFNIHTNNTVDLFAALLHDIGKIKARTFDEKYLTNHYHGHEQYSIEMAKTILKRLCFDNKTIKDILLLIKYHDYELLPTKKCAKKLLNELNLALIDRLINLQIHDKQAHRYGKMYTWGYTENDRDNPHVKNYYNILKFGDIAQKVIDENEVFGQKDVAINGNDLIKLGFNQGKELGDMLKKCLEYIIENPDKNNKEDLIDYVKGEIQNCQT